MLGFFGPGEVQHPLLLVLALALVLALVHSGHFMLALLRRILRGPEALRPRLLRELLRL